MKPRRLPQCSLSGEMLEIAYMLYAGTCSTQTVLECALDEPNGYNIGGVIERLEMDGRRFA